jgi:O-succinylbenzoate synthase
MVGAAGYGYVNGDPMKLLTPFDTDGRKVSKFKVMDVGIVLDGRIINIFISSSKAQHKPL